jgi:hypothetical protein
MRFRLLLVPVLAAAMLAMPAGYSQDEPPPSKKGKFGGGPKSSPSAAKDAELKKYDDVIPKDAKTLPGVFAVHQVGEKIFFEIPQDGLGKLMLWQGEVAKGPGGGSFNGAALGSAVLKFERRGNKVYVWRVGFAKRADGKAIQSAVEAAGTDSIIASYPVECEGKDRSTVINVSSFFVSGVADLPVSRAGGAGGSVDEGRSYVSEVKAFPTNIEVRSLLTFRGGSGGVNPFGPTPPGGGGNRSTTALIHHSLTALPDAPMRGRYFDPRVGYFTERFSDFADTKQPWTVTKQFIARYRLEKKDPTAEVSEPVKPIVFYLAPEIPEKWRSYLKQGVEDWKPAFEKAGFKNAIVCKDAPTRAEDPTWDPEDARHSVIRWVAEPVMNAMGPHVHDPRSGEIISAHIIFWHDVVKLAQLWYFVQCSAVDDHARKLPLGDELTGQLLRYICCHEVGHTIGLRHNHRASQAYSVSQLRDPAFTAKYGSVASIMSYGRFNYVCQPGDGVKCLIPVLGPYDFFAIEWGYKPIPSAKSATDEKKTLDEWAAKQVSEPFLRFGGEDGPSIVDPTVLTENIGSDPVQATAMGLKNLDRVMDYLVAATTEKGEDFSLLEEVYKEILGHRRNWFGAVAKQVGGVVEYRTLAGRNGETFVRVPKEKQKEAVKFLLDNAFSTPAKVLNPAVLNQFRYAGVANEVTTQQEGLLRSLLSTSRLSRLFDAEVLSADKAYPAVELVGDVQDGLFAELKAAAPKVDPLRRNLQRTYIDLLKDEFDPPAAAGGAPTPTPRRGGAMIGEGGRTSELRAVARVQLGRLEKQLADALPKAKDPATVAHLEDSLAQVRKALDAKK